ncbi:MAG: chemotaxis protein CheW [Gammaproteobacteria bacterium]|nr:chemotaxis protein CheW [Gammaproteobacteria bacterium]
MSDLTTFNSETENPVMLKSKYKNALHCLVIPLENEKIILPNTAVAEVITYVNPDAIENAPDWLLGKISWRDQAIPLISYELASGANETGISARRIAVLNTLNGNAQLPYLAILIQGIPQLRLIQEDNISDEELPDTYGHRQAISACVKLNEELILVPDLDDLETRIQDLHLI